MKNNPIYDFFEQDHRRLEAILDEATKDPDNIDATLYEEFRIGLLTHIKMEEKILFPAAQKANGGVALPEAAQLRLEHSAITLLMVPPPTLELIRVINNILEIHDEVEERPGGMYETCEKLAKNETEEILKALEETTPVPVHPHNVKPYVLDTVRRSLERAGYSFDELAKE